ncbi:MAG: sulfurtransferase TusA family protein [Nitrospirota bacterium]
MVTIPEEVLKEIEAFGREVKRLQNKEIPEEKFKKFRLQQGIYGQRQKGVQMVRVKIPSGFLNAEKLRTLADVVTKYSTGKCHVTTRQDIQFHFVKLDHITTILTRLAEVGLTTREACGNTVRNVTACHLAGACHTETFNVAPISEKVAYHLLRNPINADLPRKFKISFSGCKSECAMAAIHDIGFIAESRPKGGTSPADGSVAYGFKVYVGGGLGSSPKLAKLYSEFLPFSEVLPTCEAILKIFDANGDRKTRSKARMKFVLERWGLEKFKAEVAKEIALLKEMGNVYPDLPEPATKPLFVLPSDSAQKRIASADETDYEKWMRTNVLFMPGERVSVEIRLTLGDIAAPELLGLADIVDRFLPAGHAVPHEIRATHQQNFILHGILQESLPSLYEALRQISLAHPGAQRAIDVIACPGADTCQLALTSSMGLGDAIVNEFGKNEADAIADSGLRIRISGCPNSCAHHHIAGIGFHGVAKKVHGKLAPHYQLHLGGGVNADSPTLGKPKIKLPAKNIPQAVTKIVQIYSENRLDGELFNPFVKRYGADVISDQLIVLTALPLPADSPSSYHDYNAESDFHLDDLGPGECAGTVIDLIENYLRTSAQSLEMAQLEVRRGNMESAIERMKNAILLSCRALLIPFGVDSQLEGEILKEFQHKLVEQGIVSEQFEKLTAGLGQWTVFDVSSDAVLSSLALAGLVIAECKAAYDQMDASMKLRKKEDKVPQESNASAVSNVSGRKVDVRLDLSGVACPMNFVKTKLQLEEMETGEILEVIIDDGAPKDNVPRSVKAEGHKVLELVRRPDSHYELVIEKGG